MNVKLIALDMDGTTLNSKGKLSERTISTLKKATDKNIVVSIATGRTLSELDVITKANIDSIKYAICANGACVWDLKQKRSIYTNLLSVESIKRIYDVMAPYNFIMDAYIDGKAYAKRTSIDTLKSFGISNLHIGLLLNGRELVDNLKAYLLERGKPIEKINIKLSNPEDTRTVWHLLSEISEIAITTSGFDGIEINNKTSNKADGLLHLAKQLNINVEQIMAIGDSLNDIEMLKFAHISVAMGNADPEIKKISKFITDTNNNDGVAKAIEKYALN